MGQKDHFVANWKKFKRLHLQIGIKKDLKKGLQFILFLDCSLR